MNYCQGLFNVCVKFAFKTIMLFYNQTVKTNIVYQLKMCTHAVNFQELVIRNIPYMKGYNMTILISFYWVFGRLAAKIYR